MNPEEVCKQLIPKQYWHDVIEALGESIKLSHRYGPDKWGIRLASDGIMLKVGPHEILQLGKWDLPFHLIVDKKTVPAHLRKRGDLWFSEGSDHNEVPNAEGYYASNPGSEACHFPFKILREVYRELSHSHTEIIARAVQKHRHPSTQVTHSIELIQFIGRELGETLPQPTYIDKPEHNNIELMAEEIPSDEKYPEGASRQVLVNAYERNKDARYKCIKYYGLQCAACEMSFEETYGEIGSGFIHVHHLVELSSIGEKYDVDPVNDLRPVCPNCHAMLHRKRPAYKIEELKSIIKKQKGG